jgi:hypothetical protein
MTCANAALSGDAAVCTDIDECTLSANGGCAAGETCTNAALSGDAAVCTDIDECTLSANGGCAPGETCTNAALSGDAAVCAPAAQGLSFVSNAGRIDGTQFFADDATGYEGAAINHVFTGDFDVLIKSTGNSHMGMGMTYGPAVAGIDINDYCDFRGAFQGGIKSSLPSTSSHCGGGPPQPGCGDTGYGCKAWAHAPGTVFTGGYTWPTYYNDGVVASQTVVYSRFTRVGNILSQRYFAGGRNEWITKTIDEITTPVPLYGQTITFVSGTSIPSDSGVIITLGEASNCQKIDGGPAGCPFVIATANYVD